MIYEIAGLRIQINNKYDYTTKLCRGYVSPDQASPVHIVAEATKEEREKERLSSPSYPIGYVENICIYRDMCRQLPKFNVFIMHSAILTFEGSAYAFLGRSGTGKSTHTMLWLKHVKGASILNGDKPLISLEDGVFYAYGTPWNGKEGLGRKGKAPLKGLCFLEQAKQNSICVLNNRQYMDRLFLQCLMPEDEDSASATLNLVDSLITSVPAYLLSCDISKEAVICSFECLTDKNFADHFIKEG